VAKVKQVFLFIVAVVALASSAAAQSLVPDTGLVAEGDGRWNDALAIYRQRVEREPGAADTWLRIADIEVRLSQVDRATVALQRAAAARPDDPRIFARLSQAYAATGHAQAALHAIKGALALQPDGKIVAAGHAATDESDTSNDDMAIVRYTAGDYKPANLRKQACETTKRPHRACGLFVVGLFVAVPTRKSV